MSELYKNLFEGVEMHRPYFMGTDGKIYSAEENFDRIYNIYMKKLEQRKIPELYDNPLGCQLELTHKCNQRCRHCYNQSGCENSAKEDLSIEEWKDICHQIGEMGVFQCVISGGEPTLLGDNLFELLDILDSYKIRIIFITNGMLMDENLVRRLSKYSYDWMQISIDGSRPELHDYIRGVYSWHKAVKAADLVKRAGIPLVIAHAVVKKNLEYLEEMIDMAYYLGAYQISTGPYEMLGRAIINNQELFLTQEEIEKIYNILDKKSAQYAGKMQILASAEEVWALRLKSFEANDVLLIRPNGDVKVDCIAPFVIGNVRENSLPEIWKSIGRNIWQYPRVKEYINSLKKASDLLKISPRVNVDKDERLIPVGIGG